VLRYVGEFWWNFENVVCCVGDIWWNLEDGVCCLLCAVSGEVCGNVKRTFAVGFVGGVNGIVNTVCAICCVMCGTDLVEF
jgi:hypothetical protein